MTMPDRSHATGRPGRAQSPYRRAAVGVITLVLLAACEQRAPANNAYAASGAARWCDQLPRPANKALTRVDAGTTWFDVYQVDTGVYALVESHQFQEAISYLVLGTKRALLFDGGIGVVAMRPVIERLTALPVTVMNSHTHYDHVGANHEFGSVLGMDTPYTRRNEGGKPHAGLAGEVAAESFCAGAPEGLDTANFHTQPWTVTRRVADGDTVDLGGRVLEILHMPGHTPDATALLDRAHGLLFTGDSYYAGPIWLFASETNLDAYERSMARMVALAPTLRRVLPGHNTANEPPSGLAVVAAAARTMRTGGGRRTVLEGSRLQVTVGAVEFMTSQALLAGKRGADTAGGSGLGPVP